MKLLIVGSNSNYAIERHYLKYLKSYYQVEFFDSKSIFLEFYNSGLFNKVLFRCGLSNIYNEINKRLNECIDKFCPQIILIFKGMEILPSTLKNAKKKGIYLANYNPDSPFIFSGKGSGNKNVKKSLELYDLHITYDLSIKQKLQADYNVQTELLPFGYEISNELIASLVHQEEVNKPCFIGMPDKYRANFIRTIANNGISIDVYGLNWRSYINHKNVTIHEPVYDEDLYCTLFKYRVQLNYMRPHNFDSHNMRTFEIPAIGGIQLAPDTPDHRLYFKENQEIFTYSDINQCVKKIQQIMSLSLEDSSLIRKNSRKRCILSKYSYKDRAYELHIILTKMVS